MEAKDALEQTLSIDYINLVPSTINKTDLYFITSDDFNRLITHLKISDYLVAENDYDTITISNRIFKKIK